MREVMQVMDSQSSPSAKIWWWATSNNFLGQGKFHLFISCKKENWNHKFYHVFGIYIVYLFQVYFRIFIYNMSVWIFSPKIWFKGILGVCWNCMKGVAIKYWEIQYKFNMPCSKPNKSCERCICLVCRHNLNLAYFYDKDILGLTVVYMSTGHSVCICFLHPIMLPMSGWPLNNNRHWFWKYCH